MQTEAGQGSSDPQQMPLRYASYSGTATEVRSTEFKGFSRKPLPGIAEKEDSVSDLDGREGRKFVLLQKFPDKHLSKQRRMSSVVGAQGKDLAIPNRPSVTLPALHSFAAVSNDGFNTSYNQDALLSVQNIKGIENTALFAVFDGHGVGGDQVAHYAKDQVYQSFLADYGSNGKPTPDSEIPALFEKCFIGTQDNMEKSGNQFLLSGTTASVVLIQGLSLIVSNVGDSRVVLGRECVCCAPLVSNLQKGFPASETTSAHIIAVPMTIDHRVGEIAEERARVEKCGGSVIMDPNLPPDAWDELRIYAQGQTYPGLVTTRTLGDVLAHGIGVISTPDTCIKSIDKHDKILILASDGVWDIVSSQEAINLVSRYDDPTEATNALIAACVKGWSDEYDAGDNVSAIVLFLNPFRAPKNNTPTCKRTWTIGSVCVKEDIAAAKSNPTTLSEYQSSQETQEKPKQLPIQQAQQQAQPQVQVQAQPSQPSPQSPQNVIPPAVSVNARELIPVPNPNSPRKGRSSMCTLL